jgi:hypothetical protein
LVISEVVKDFRRSNRSGYEIVEKRLYDDPSIGLSDVRIEWDLPRLIKVTYKLRKPLDKMDMNYINARVKDLNRTIGQEAVSAEQSPNYSGSDGVPSLVVSWKNASMELMGRFEFLLYGTENTILCRNV